MSKFRLVLSFLFLIFICFTSSVFSQVVPKQANKIQLIDGVKMETKNSKHNLIKIEATGIVSVDKKNQLSNLKRKQKIARKPEKVLKYKKRDLKAIKDER